MLFGPGGMRAGEQADRIQDVKNLLRYFGADDAAQASDDVMRDLVSKRSANLDRWSNMQKEVLETVGKEKPGQTVPMTSTIKQIDESIAYLKGLKTESVKPAIATLTDWKTAIKDQSPENILTLRRQIGEVFAAPELTSVRSTMQKQLSGIYKKVNDDLSAFIGDTGDSKTLTKWKVANKELSKMMGELDLDILRNTLDKGTDRPEVVMNMLMNKDRSVIQALNRNLTSSGRESARSAIMQAVGKKIGDDASPEKFLTEIRKLRNSGDPIGVFFTGDDLKYIEGVTRVLKATSRASQAVANPATGQQLLIPLSLIGMGGGGAAIGQLFDKGIGGFLGVLGSMGAAGAAGGALRLYESPAFRNILMKLPTVAAGSAEEAGLFKRLVEVAQAQNASKAANSKDRRTAEQALADER